MKPGKKDEAAEKQRGSSSMRDALEVVGTLAVILILLRLLLGANMPVPLVAVVSCSMLHEDDVLGTLDYAIAQGPGSFLMDSQCKYVDGRNWRSWLAARIPGVDIEAFPFKSGFSVGDMILVVTPDGSGTILPFFSETRVGDVIIYKRDNRARGGEPIIHRVAGVVVIRDGKVAEVEGTMDCFTKQDFEGMFVQYVVNCQKQTGVCQYRDYPQGNEYRFYITKGDNNIVSDQCHSLQPILPVPDSQVIARGWIRIPYLGWLKMLLNGIMNLVVGVLSLALGA